MYAEVKKRRKKNYKNEFNNLFIFFNLQKKTTTKNSIKKLFVCVWVFVINH